MLVMGVQFSVASEEGKAISRLPVLAWTQRSDWANVKNPPMPTTTDKLLDSLTTEVPVAAKGDGVADDTIVIQDLLDKVTDGQTIYFPPGRYRITHSLRLAPDPKRGWLGITLIGHGRDTVLFWDGPVGGTMFQQHSGWACSRYVGLTWDGRGKAGIGILHRSGLHFETENRHQYEAFLNFTEAGIHAGGGKVATAEMLYENCLFENCKVGLLVTGRGPIVNFNYLDHTVKACEFRKCGQGTFAGPGSNMYVKESHFEGSGDWDMSFWGEAGNSVRRCTSLNSGSFVENGGTVGPLVIQDCRIEGWKNGARGAFVSKPDCAPVLLFDTVFSRPPPAGSGVDRVSGSGSASGACIEIQAKHFLANTRLVDAEGVAKELTPSVNPALGYAVPLAAALDEGCLSSATQSFFRTQVDVPAKIFDAKRDFGAQGNGRADDTAAIQKTIDAARGHGQGALAYLPKGTYVVSATLTMKGSNYRVGGSGFGTGLVWKGPAGGTTLAVTDPDRLILENIVIGRHDYAQGNNAVDILQTGSGSGEATRMNYDRVAVFGMYQKQPNVRGLKLLNLSKKDKVYIHEVNGNVHITDCAEATIYLGLSYEGTLCVDGKSLKRGGLIGGSVRLGTVTDPGLWVKDNQSIVMSDFYVESSGQYMKMDGDANLPAGRVTLQGPKYEILPESKAPSTEVQNYKGTLFLGPYNFYVGNPVHRFKQTGISPFTQVLWGSSFYESRPGIEMAAGTKFMALGNRGLGDKQPPADAPGFCDTKLREEALAQIALALNDLRRLGQAAVELGYGR